MLCDFFTFFSFGLFQVRVNQVNQSYLLFSYSILFLNFDLFCYVFLQEVQFFFFFNLDLMLGAVAPLVELTWIDSIFFLNFLITSFFLQFHHKIIFPEVFLFFLFSFCFVILRAGQSSKLELACVFAHNIFLFRLGLFYWVLFLKVYFFFILI